jgi:putative glutamine amidotransferase
MLRWAVHSRSDCTKLPGLLDHRDDDAQPLAVQYAPAHDVTLWSQNGMLSQPGRRLTRKCGSIRCIRRGWSVSRPTLVVEARAPDGVIEAFRVKDAPRFALAVQWHPEWQVMSDSFSRAMFAAFGAASRERAQLK